MYMRNAAGDISHKSKYNTKSALFQVVFLLFYENIVKRRGKSLDFLSFFVYTVFINETASVGKGAL